MKEISKSFVVFMVMFFGCVSIVLWALFALFAIGQDQVIFEYGFYAGICQIVWMIGIYVVDYYELN